MTTAHLIWTVRPHGPLVALANNVLTVTGGICTPIGEIPRRMTVVRLGDGRLAVYSAVSLDEPRMRELEAFGTPAFLVVPGYRHRLDAKIWKDRYPGMQVLAPSGGRDEIEKVVRVDDVRADFGDPAVSLVDVAGIAGKELALVVDSGDGVTVVLNDILFNLPVSDGLGGLLRRLLGFAGSRPQIPTPIGLAWIDDRNALARQFREWAALPLRRVLVSHGDPIDDRPVDVLHAIANELGR